MDRRSARCCRRSSPSDSTPCGETVHIKHRSLAIIVVLLVLGSAASAQPLVDAAMERLAHQVTYDGSYRRIDYPNGDVPDQIGVCTDVVIRAYRAVGIDLQVAVHEDMQGSFEKYPQNWGHRGPDANIDHRRVPNLQVFFERNGVVLEKSNDPAAYAPGDLVTWMLPGNLPHIGIVVARRSSDGHRPLIVHNIGAGPQLEDVLFRYPITGHYRYRGSK